MILHVRVWPPSGFCLRWIKPEVAQAAGPSLLLRPIVDSSSSFSFHCSIPFDLFNSFSLLTCDSTFKVSVIQTPRMADSSGLQVDVQKKNRDHEGLQLNRDNEGLQQTPYYRQEYNNWADPRKDKRKILGLNVALFWPLVVLLVLILAGAIGGGVYAGLNTQKSSSSGSRYAPLLILNRFALSYSSNQKKVANTME